MAKIWLEEAQPTYLVVNISLLYTYTDCMRKCLKKLKLKKRNTLLLLFLSLLALQLGGSAGPPAHLTPLGYAYDEEGS